jgi:hypothetical protein
MVFAGERVRTTRGGTMSGGICGAALVRAANALLAALGGDQVSLILPDAAMAADAGGQLGLVDPGVQEVIIAPAVARNLTTGNLGPRRRIEFTLPAAAIDAQLSELGMGTADDLFQCGSWLEIWGRPFSYRESCDGELCWDCIFLCGDGSGVTRISVQCTKEAMRSGNPPHLAKAARCGAPKLKADYAIREGQFFSGATVAAGWIESGTNGHD